MKRKSCEYSSKVSAFADHELLLTEGSAFENHLKTCSACSAELEQVNYVRDRLRLLKTPDLPSPLPMRGDLGSKPARLTLKELFGRRISIPVPVALLMVAGLLAPALFLALRSQQSPQTSVVRVEVPVERVVVQVETPATPPRVAKKSVSRRRSWLPSDISTVSARLGTDPLKGFRPPDTANIRVVNHPER